MNWRGAAPARLHRGGLLAATAAVCFLAGPQAATAQGKVRIESKVEQKGPGADVKVRRELTTGTVREYEAGSKIELAGPGDKTYTFDLDENARVVGTITPGAMATVEWTKDDAGTERVTVLTGRGSTKGAAEMATREPASGHEMHMKSETTMHRPGPDVKRKTEMVVGTVRKYEPGRKITVTGPNHKDVTFDLGEGVGTKGDVAVGRRVRVEYTKADDGSEHVTVVTLVPEETRKSKKAS